LTRKRYPDSFLVNQKDGKPSIQPVSGLTTHVGYWLRSESGAMTFPQIVGALVEAGFDGYAIDLRLGAAAYYPPDREAVELEAMRTTAPVAERFDAAIGDAIGEVQALAPG